MKQGLSNDRKAQVNRGRYDAMTTSNALSSWQWVKKISLVMQWETAHETGILHRTVGPNLEQWLAF